MKVFRLCKELYAEDLSGDGARLSGGRWNRKGIPALYTAENIALTVLEYLVHVPLGLIPAKLKVVAIEVPDSVPGSVLLPEDLPANWNMYPSPPETVKLGTDWLIKADELFLKVPSAVVPLCSNIILNPNHPMMHLVKVRRADCFVFDPRLLV